MDTLTIAFVCIAALALGVNMLVTWAVARSRYYSRFQKSAQLAIVWLLPVVGAIGVGMFLYSQRDNPIFDTRAYPERSKKAVPIEIEQAVHGHE